MVEKWKHHMKATLQTKISPARFYFITISSIMKLIYDSNNPEKEAVFLILNEFVTINLASLKATCQVNFQVFSPHAYTILE